MTSKLQVTLPKAVAERHGIQPRPDVPERLRRFDQATRRQETRNAAHRGDGRETRAAEGRGWSREDLYGRPRPR